MCEANVQVSLSQSLGIFPTIRRVSFRPHHRVCWGWDSHARLPKASERREVERHVQPGGQVCVVFQPHTHSVHGPWVGLLELEQHEPPAQVLFLHQDAATGVVRKVNLRQAQKEFLKGGEKAKQKGKNPTRIEIGVLEFTLHFRYTVLCITLIGAVGWIAAPLARGHGAVAARMLGQGLCGEGGYLGGSFRRRSEGLSIKIGHIVALYIQNLAHPLTPGENTVVVFRSSGYLSEVLHQEPPVGRLGATEHGRLPLCSVRDEHGLELHIASH